MYQRTRGHPPKRTGVRLGACPRLALALEDLAWRLGVKIFFLLFYSKFTVLYTLLRCGVARTSKSTNHTGGAVGILVSEGKLSTKSSKKTTNQGKQSTF
jgi:hypothetical protein